MSDELNITAQGYKTIYHEGSDKVLLAQIRNIVKEYEIDNIVIGMPINLDGTTSKRMEVTQKFLHKLKCDFPKIKIDWIDERLTTRQAINTLNEMDLKFSRKKEIEDTLSATYILEMYMARLKNS